MPGRDRTGKCQIEANNLKKATLTWKIIFCRSFLFACRVQVVVVRKVLWVVVEQVALLVAATGLRRIQCAGRRDQMLVELVKG